MYGVLYFVGEVKNKQDVKQKLLQQNVGFWSPAMVSLFLKWLLKRIQKSRNTAI